MYAHTYVMVKVISLSNSAYETISKIKGEKESFSDVILKLAKKKKGSIMDIFGCAKEDKEFIDSLKKAYKERDKEELRVY